MKKVAVLTGAGISAESGIPTFRGAGGLWENHRAVDLATPEAWQRDPELVLRFYNMRRQTVAEAEPNAAHFALAKLEERYQVTVITQNVDDLHERANSKDVLHLHGEIMKVRSSADPELIMEWGPRDLSMGELCPLGTQLRPHIVWFGEPVPEYERAIPIVQEADVLFVIGTSMQVYPASFLVEVAAPGTPIRVINPDIGAVVKNDGREVLYFPEPAASAVPRIVREMLEDI